MPLNLTTGGMSARGFGFTTQGYYNLNLTISSNTSNYNVYNAAIANGWTGTNPLNLTLNINSGVVVSGTGTGTSAAIVVNSLVDKSIITINNNGTVTGNGGYVGSMQQNGYVDTTWAPGNGPNCIGTGYTYTGSNGYGYGNYSGTIYYYGYGIGGNWPVYDSYSGGTGPANGGMGGPGGTALYLASNVYVIINNSATGLFVGGGGGCGGMAGNNRSGGQGGTGGYCIEETGSHPAVIANNIAGSSSNPVVNGIIASGGGGAGGWGNRYEGEGHGGYYGASAIGIFWTGAGATPGTSPGLATNNTGTTIVSTTGTFTLSPAV